MIFKKNCIFFHAVLPVVIFEISVANVAAASQVRFVWSWEVQKYGVGVCSMAVRTKFRRNWLGGLVS
jgi:hypothetical protein